MEILELKNGSIDVNSIGTYNCLKDKVEFIGRRLDCVTNPRFKSGYFKLGNYRDSNYENKDYIMLTNFRNNLDDKLKQDIIDFLTVKLIEQMNEFIKQMNDLIK